MDARAGSELATPSAPTDTRRHLRAGVALTLFAAVGLGSGLFVPHLRVELGALGFCLLAGSLFGTALVAASLAQGRRAQRRADPDAPPSGSVPMRVLAAVSLVLSAGAARLVLQSAVGEPAGEAGSAVSSPVATLWCAGFAAAGFVVLVAERALAGTRSDMLPEAPGLTRLARLLLGALGMAALEVLQRGTGAGWAATVVGAAAICFAICAVEGCVRALAVLLLPLRATDRPSLLADNATAGLLTRPPWTLPAAGRDALQSRFGIDLSRSWALGFARRAALPIALVLVAFAWILTGVHVVPTDQRAVAERLGVPTAVFQPGLHITLPWPLGSVRPTELGTVHRIPIGSRASAGQTPGASSGDTARELAQPSLPPAPSRAGEDEDEEAELGRPVPEMSLSEAGSANTSTEPAALEGDPPISEDRLWDTRHTGDVGFLIASAAGARQSFAVLQADVSVLYRVGLDDASALRAAYAVDAPEALVRSVAGAIVERRLARLSLADALGGDRARIEHDLLGEIRRALDDLGSGIDVMAVVVEAMHPPAEAANAYHRVQAAEILAAAGVAGARSRASTAMQAAQSSAATEQAAAVAAAADTVAAARIDALGFAADDSAWRAGPEAFRLERYLARLTKGLANSELLLLDPRLDEKSVPLLDLRESSSGSREPAPELELEDPRLPVH